MVTIAPGSVAIGAGGVAIGGGGVEVGAGTISISAQFVGGLLLAAGLLTPFATVSLVGPMAVVVMQKWSKGFFNVRGGYEFMLLLLVIGIAFAISGPGAISVDSAIGFSLALPIRAGIVLATLLAALIAVIPTRSTAPAPR